MVDESKTVFPAQHFSPNFEFKLMTDPNIKPGSRVAMLCAQSNDEVKLVYLFKVEKAYVNIVAYDVQTWTMDGLADDVDDRYFYGTIKWDGCAHLFFGRESPSDGYIHVCGYETARLLNASVAAAFELAKQVLPSWYENHAQPNPADFADYKLTIF